MSDSTSSSAQSPTPSVPSSLNDPATLAEATILIIDDTGMNRTVLRLILTQAGGLVVEAKSAADALARIAQKVPDLILLDVVMPDVDGYQFCEQLKNHPTASQVPVIFISSRSDADTKVKAFLLGGADYVTKPFQPAEVVARVKHQIRIARLQHALEREKAQLLQMNEDLVRAQKQTEAMFGALSEHLPGAVLDGKYEIGEVIGTGGFGVVYRALHIGLQRPVAIKVFKPTNTSQAEAALERFRQEGISACRINHPNAVGVLDSGVSREGIPYLVMELLSGMPLSAELACYGALPLGRCIQILVPVCQVLIAAHSTGILHRDIKPDNVFLHRTPEGEVVKVLDFGISKILGQDGEQREQRERPRNNQTREGSLIGTPIYMAPERIRGGIQDGRSDVYSVGIMFYEMLSGHVPFVTIDDDLVAMLLEQLTKDPRPLHELRPDVPGAVEKLVMSTLEKDPTKRPDMRTFLQELLQIADSELGHEARLSLIGPTKIEAGPSRLIEVVSVGANFGDGRPSPHEALVNAYDKTMSEQIPDAVRESVLRQEEKR